MITPHSPESSCSSTLPPNDWRPNLHPGGTSETCTDTCLESTGACHWFIKEIHSHEDQLKAYLRKSFPAIRDIDDLVQESYLRVWRRHLQKPVVSAKAFLFMVARHLALDHLRHTRTSPIEATAECVLGSTDDDDPGVVESVCIRQEIKLLQDAIQSLPARCREIVILRKVQGVSQREIARRLQLSEMTVQNQAFRGLRRCQEMLAKQGLARRSA